MSQTAKDILINRAITLFKEGQIEKCLKETLVAKKKFPDEPFIFNLLGVLYAHKKSYEDSIKSYSRAIKLNTNYFEAYNNMGIAYTAWKKNNKAIEFFDKAIGINPLYAEAFNNKGNACKEKGDYQSAIECYDRAVDLNPMYIDAISNAGIVYDILDDFSKAETCYKKALALSPNNTSVLYNLANCLFNFEDFSQSIEVCQKIIDLDPSFYFAYNRMGLCFIQIANEERAKVFFKKAISVKPDYIEGLTNYGFVLQKQRNYSLAIIQFKKALSIDPTNEEALLNLSRSYFDDGRVLKSVEIAQKGLLSKQKSIPLLKNLIASLLSLNRLGEASKACKKILLLDNEDADAINLMGTIFEKQGSYDRAKKQFLRALELDNGLILAKMNIATLYQIEGNIEKANNIYTDLEKDHPENDEILYRKSEIAIQLEEFEEGWKNFEHRWRVFPMNKVSWPIQDKPLWKGERGVHVALWKEQGIGDQILCLSLVAEVKKMCGSLSVYVDPRLRALCMRAMSGINFVKDLEELQNVECNYHLPMGSMPGLIRNDIRDFDKTVTGYLKADPNRVEAIRNELQLEGKTVIGISWRSFKTLNEVKKSIQLRDMQRIFSGLDVVLVNLQYGDVEDEIREFKQETGIEVIQCASVDNREDLDGLAALIEVCDLVVSTSNVTVHLAGALAKETWVMLPYVRVIFWWLLERTDSVWYPSLTLYRQPKLNDWESVYISMRKDLEDKFVLEKP